MTFEDHYSQFLGYDPRDKRPVIVCRSPVRDKLEKQRKPLLLSFWDQQRTVLSVSRDLEDGVRKFIGAMPDTLLNKDEWFSALDDLMYDSYKTYRLEEFLRLSLDKEDLCAAVSNLDLVRQMTGNDKDLILNQADIRKRGSKVKKYVWSYESRWIKEGKKFAISDDGIILSEAVITEVEYSGGNIAVGTHDDHRRKGYGKAVVHRAAAWCLQNDIVPIYWVRKDNAASIALAKSLGFTIKHEEIIVTHWPGDAAEKYNFTQRLAEER